MMGTLANIGKEEVVAGTGDHEHCFLYSMCSFIGSPWQLLIHKLPIDTKLLPFSSPLTVTPLLCHLHSNSYGLVVDVYGSMLEVLRDTEFWA